MTENVENTLSDKQFIRYSKQVMLPRFGEKGQLIIKRARVAIIGVGGLGQQVAQLLSAAGFGEVVMIDPDVVALDNLPRQLLYSDADIGLPKVSVACEKLSQRNPDSTVVPRRVAFSEQHSSELDGCHLVIDCSDNFKCRHAVNRAAVLMEIPLISGAISADLGLVGLFNPQDNPSSGCYQCLFPESITTINRCSSMGVLGTAVSVIASLQSQWAINFLLQQQENHYGRLIRFNAQTLELQQTALTRDPSCPVCGSIKKEKC